ncbi:MAG: flagellar filament capping protein FliD [Deltaproteobacteria bacterium]|nr:flagellar filament capping protein FliD [Deltaproteobacteria bacterium]
MASTNLVSGLSSGFDWQNMITQLMAIEHRRVDLVETRKTETQTKLSAWQSFNSKLLAFRTAAEAIKDPTDFQLFSTSMTSNSGTIEAEDLLSVITGEEAAEGTYSVTVTNLAKAQKLSSNPFTSRSESLGSAYAGDIIINGKVLTISETDTLATVASGINNLNTGNDPSGVTASIIKFAGGDYRIILTSGSTGAGGMSLLNGSSNDLVQRFGWKDNDAATLKNAITNGAQSDRFSSATVALKSLLGLTTGESGDVTIGDKTVHIDLSIMSLTDIKTAINTAAPAGVTASIISQTVEDQTFYRLQIDGTQTISDAPSGKNILNALGLLDHTSDDVTGKISGNAMTTEGAFIQASTLLKDIDGYNVFTAGGEPAGDFITLTGMKTDGTSAGTNVFNIEATTTVQDLLNEIELRYGDVLAYVTSDGKIRIDDLTGGGSLVVNLADAIHDTNSKLEFTDGDADFNVADLRKRQVIAGADASIEIDGVTITSSDNIVDDVIPGVTLNLLKADDETEVTLTVSRDIEAVKRKISDFVSKYNDVMSFINKQFSYDAETKKTGGVLFGDGTLTSVKAGLSTLVTRKIWGINSNFAIMGLAGINLDNSQLLTINDKTLTDYLKTNFSDIKSLFVGQGTAFGASLSYVGHTRDTQAGDYDIHVDRAATRATETGNVNLAAGGAEETLSVTQNGQTATIAVTSGMSLDDIINAINTEFDATHTQKIAGSTLLTENDGITKVSSETTWYNIIGTTLANGDAIAFNGMNRTGTIISGSYTIDDAATDTVQGLLGAIEEAFQGQVDADIDTSGRIVLTDRYGGSSQLALNIDEPAGKGLDFGTISTSNPGGTKGRYALSLHASDDGSNHLLIQSEDYGTSSTFTISQDTSDSNYNQIIYAGAQSTTATSNGTVSINGSTTWSDVFGADTADGDTITITGKARDGMTDISGTYTISDRTSDTIGGLLSAIESVYAAQGTNVDASIRDGAVCVEDLTAGLSNIALTLTANNEGGGSLNLGTFDQITKRDLDLGLVDGTYSGVNVAGTIGGEEATGLGQVLTGNSGNVSTDGLSVSYRGTTDGADAGTITLTIGTADLFYRQLFNMTDSLDGYVIFKQQSLQSSITDYTTQIEQMEAILDRKQQNMINRFVAMELAISKIQSQSNWLAGQITAAENAWN